MMRNELRREIRIVDGLITRTICSDKCRARAIDDRRVVPQSGRLSLMSAHYLAEP
jgi:hypothetical protein